MPDVDLVTEDTPCLPLSPYGETKLAYEWLVRAAYKAHGISTACLRYFNVAGAATPELADTGVFNLVPMVFERYSAGEGARIFGDDYPTPDGTCIRDYIHVEDLADAHVVAARKLAEWGAQGQYQDLTVNIGRGEGVSVREMVELMNAHTGHDLAPVVTPRRPGDPAKVVASADKIAAELGWKAKHDVREMITSAWAGWEANREGALDPMRPLAGTYEAGTYEAARPGSGPGRAAFVCGGRGGQRSRKENSASQRSVISALEYRRTSRNAVSPSRSRRPPSDISTSRCPASSIVLPSLASSPSSPCRTISRTPGAQSKATTGRPAAIASSSVMGNPSAREACAKTEAPRSAPSTSSVLPIHCTDSSMPSSAACARSFGSSTPAP